MLVYNFNKCKLLNVLVALLEFANNYKLFQILGISIYIIIWKGCSFDIPFFFSLYERF